MTAHRWILAGLLLTSIAQAQRATMRTDGKHPVAVYDGNERYLPRFAKQLAKLDASSEHDNTFWRGLHAAVALWHMKQDEPRRALAVRSCKAALGDNLTAPIEQVCARISDRGSVDKILCTTDEPPFATRRVARGIGLRGRFAHVAQGSDSWLYLVDGAELSAGERRIARNTHFAGVLTKTRRVEAGDALDAFETAEPLPTDGSLDGHTLMVDIGGLLVQSFRIARIERRGAATLIHSANEPGMTITPGLVKLEYYPCWGIKGEARFAVAASALGR